MLYCASTIGIYMRRIKQNKTTKLKRSLGLGALLIYGIGDILGAGVYALLGKVAAQAGSYTWVAFTIACAVAVFTGLSYAELSSRHPKSSGAAHYVAETFKSPVWPLLVGCLLRLHPLFR